MPGKYVSDHGPLLRLLGGRRFIVKQLQASEKRSMQEITPSYFRYLANTTRKAAPTCLAKIMGIYTVCSGPSGLFLSSSGLWSGLTSIAAHARRFPQVSAPSLDAHRSCMGPSLRRLPSVHTAMRLAKPA